MERDGCAVKYVFVPKRERELRSERVVLVNLSCRNFSYFRPEIIEDKFTGLRNEDSDDYAYDSIWGVGTHMWNWLNQGTDFNQRIGKCVSWKYCQMRVNFASCYDAVSNLRPVGNVNVRMVVYWWKPRTTLNCGWKYIPYDPVPPEPPFGYYVPFLKFLDGNVVYPFNGKDFAGNYIYKFAGVGIGSYDQCEILLEENFTFNVSSPCDEFITGGDPVGTEHGADEYPVRLRGDVGGSTFGTTSGSTAPGPDPPEQPPLISGTVVGNLNGEGGGIVRGVKTDNVSGSLSGGGTMNGETLGAIEGGVISTVWAMSAPAGVGSIEGPSNVTVPIGTSSSITQAADLNFDHNLVGEDNGWQVDVIDGVNVNTNLKITDIQRIETVTNYTVNTDSVLVGVPYYQQVPGTDPPEYITVWPDGRLKKKCRPGSTAGNWSVHDDRRMVCRRIDLDGFFTTYHMDNFSFPEADEDESVRMDLSGALCCQFLYSDALDSLTSYYNPLVWKQLCVQGSVELGYCDH